MTAIMKVERNGSTVRLKLNGSVDGRFIRGATMTDSVEQVFSGDNETVVVRYDEPVATLKGRGNGLRYENLGAMVTIRHSNRRVRR